jgi:hypothetical protein
MIVETYESELRALDWARGAIYIMITHCHCYVVLTKDLKPFLADGPGYLVTQSAFCTPPEGHTEVSQSVKPNGLVAPISRW